MSMLAEPRKRQKWSIDPRNSNWSSDDSKFGQKLMERMGWAKGKGLGRREQGMTEHIKVKVKNDQNGLGTSTNYEDNWIAHQDDFNELLTQLNNCHGQNRGADAPPAEKPKGFSLEEKSKTSKKRVHYMKFAKGKDLSSRSETDLNCIFGKRGRPAKQEQETSCRDSPGETGKTLTPAPIELDTQSITTTVKSSLTMQQYFAQQMARMKSGCGAAQSAAPSTESEETSGPLDEPGPVGPSDVPGPFLIVGDSEEPKKKKKKKKKGKKSTADLEVVEDHISAAPVINEDKLQERPKKKMRKVVESEGATTENGGSASGVAQDCEELPPSKKKLKKGQEDTELLNGQLRPAEDQTVECEVVLKKKKKRRAELEDVAKEEKLVVKKSKKDKKK